MLDSDLPPVRSHDATAEPWLEERYHLVAKATNDAIWDWNLATDHVEWNDGVYTLFGYGRDEVSPNAGWWYETIHPDDRERVVQGIHLAQDQGEPVWTDEYRFRRADGTYAWVTDRGYCVFDESGRPQRMVGAIHDQSERRRQEEALREANGRLSAQADELRAANEALCDNAAEFESQQEELQAAHEELADLYERLRRHNEAVEAEVQQRTAEVGRYTEAWRELAEGYAASATGDAFFKSLAAFLARALGVDYVLIGTLLPPPGGPRQDDRALRPRANRREHGVRPVRHPVRERRQPVDVRLSQGHPGPLPGRPRSDRPGSRQLRRHAALRH
ncbi:MAG: PAS domain-containing protein [Candidatus Sericytochromatia bacterium]